MTDAVSAAAGALLPRFKPYPTYKDSGVEWLGEIPAHWETRRLKFAAHIEAGQSPPSELVTDGSEGLPFLQGNADFGSLNPIPRQVCDLSPKRARPADILLSVRAPVGALNIADQAYGIGRGLCAISAADSLDLQFCFYLLTRTRSQLDAVATGSTYDAVTTSQVGDLPTLLPPPAEQRAISAFLDCETSKIDALVAKKERLIELLEEKRTALITRAVTKGLDPNVPMKDSGVEWLGQIPAHWEAKRIKWVARMESGHTPDKKVEAYWDRGDIGSGKSFTIAWLAHQLATLHDAYDRRVFDSIVVITDRRVLDRQLQTTMRQFERTLGVVENIDTTSRQLKEALESGKTIIVTTLQKFPVIAKEITELPGKRFAVIVDEAHSSQSGERSTQPMKDVFRAASLEEAEAADEPEPDDEDYANAVAEAHRWPKTTSLFAFTATPKPKTLELFGRKRDNGKYEAFHLYSMRQAIEEGFILDVLANYTTYTAYWRLLKTIEADPRYHKRKAEYLLKSFVELHPHAINEKVKVCVEHFAAQVQHEIGGKAKAMIVTRSRKHAVRYRLAVDRYLAEKGYPFKALVAFSGSVEDDGRTYTESGMNSAGSDRTIGERQTAREFERPEYRFLIVANKFQTGFDQPLLHTMYVDKKLGGVNAVQTLSRLNRTLPPDKRGAMVLDFANEAEGIRAAFEPYYETTLLSEATDPNLLYEIQSRLLGFPAFTEGDVRVFWKVYSHRTATQDQIYSVLAPVLERFCALPEEEQQDFRGQLTDFARLYAFLSQILTFTDADLEKLYAFVRHLRRLLPGDRAELPREVQQNIDMESYRVQQTGTGRIALDRNKGVLEPQGTRDRRGVPEEEMEALSRIIAELNERFGLNLGPEHRVTLGQMMDRLDEDAALDASARVNARENVRLAFDQKVEHVIQEILDSNFELYKRITDDRSFGEALKNYLFDHYLREHRQAEELIKHGESKTLEFKSTLRWSLKENRQDDKGVTQAVLKTIAAFLNTEGGDLLIGVADDGSVVGVEHDDLESDDKFMRHLAQVVRNGLGDRASTCIDPKMQVVQGKTVCVVSCQRSPEPVLLKWKGMESSPEGDFYVRSGPGTVRLPPDSASEYVRTRFAGVSSSRAASAEGAV